MNINSEGHNFIKGGFNESKRKDYHFLLNGCNNDLMCRNIPCDE